MTTQAAQKQIETSVNRVFELARDLALNVKPRPNLQKALQSIHLFAALPKGEGYANDVAIVQHCLDKGAIDADLIELGLIGVGFIVPNR